MSANALEAAIAGDGPVAVLPKGWPRPKGYANAMRARGTVLVTGGLVGWDAAGTFAAGFVRQVRQVLENVRAVLEAGGARPEHLVRLTWYVTDIDAYRANLPAIGAAYRDVLGRHFPAMAVIGVSTLVEPAAMVEIEATAIVPG